MSERAFSLPLQKNGARGKSVAITVIQNFDPNIPKHKKGSAAPRYRALATSLKKLICRACGEKGHIARGQSDSGAEKLGNFRGKRSRDHRAHYVDNTADSRTQSLDPDFPIFHVRSEIWC